MNYLFEYNLVEWNKYLSLINQLVFDLTKNLVLFWKMVLIRPSFLKQIDFLEKRNFWKLKKFIVIAPSITQILGI